MTSDQASENKVVLAIEAAVRGGSISLIENSREIAARCGTDAVSRAEDLLANIADLLEQMQIEKRRIGLIAVSNGPGSYTGIRIGLATALGLARALHIECIGVPLMPAIAEFHRKEADCIIVIPMGRSEFCWQAFKSFDGPNPSDHPLTGAADDFLEYSQGLAGYDLLIQHDAFEVVERMPGFNNFKSRASDCGRDLALSVGLASRNRVSDLTPNYVRNSQFSSSPV